MIQKSDNGNLLIIIDKDVYIKHIESFLNGKAKFEIQHQWKANPQPLKQTSNHLPKLAS